MYHLSIYKYIYFCQPMLEKMRPHSPNSKTWPFDINKKHFYEKNYAENLH